MTNKNKYGLLQFRKEFGTEKQCLKMIFEASHSYECSCGGSYTPLESRRQYQCSKCRFQIAPTANTIFHKSDTPLTLWFYAIFIFSTAKSGLSAKQLQRQLGVTYKTAWRMLTFIRKAIPQSESKLKGDVEMDSGFMGGHGNAGKDNKDLGKVMKGKSVVMAAVERGGKIRAKVTFDNTAWSIQTFLQKNVDTTARLITDASHSYITPAKEYKRETINHKKEYVRGDIHINTIETFWSHVKRSVKGTHKAISKKYLQSYLDGFVFHYNNRHSDKERFSSLLGALLLASK